MEAPVTRRESWLVYLIGVLVVFVITRFGFVACSESMHLRSDYDLNIYYLIGNGWMRGLLPYVDLSDLKGPLVFLLHGVCSLLTPGSFLGICIVNALIAGVGLLFAYKTARLFLPAAGSVGVLGVYLYFLLYFSANPAEQVWALQHVTLYMVMRWAAGRTQTFTSGEQFFLGASVAAVLLLKFNLVAFWAPVCILALVLCGWRTLLWQVGGFLVVMLPFVGYFWWHNALQALWNEYVGVALAYGRPGWMESALYTKNFALFRGMMPYHLYSRVPDWILAIPGCVPCLLWPFMWWKNQGGIRLESLVVLLASFLLLAYASYSGKYDFLHYAFVFYPFCLLSLVYVGMVLQRWQRLFMLAGCGVAMVILLIALALPLYVRYGRSYNGNAQMREMAMKLTEWCQSVPGDEVFVLDAEKGLHLYRLSGRLPSICHFVPPIVNGGSALHQEEQVEYIRTHKPMYLIGSEWGKKDDADVIARSGVPYSVTTHQQLGYPPYPAHAKQPEIILYTRLDK